MVALATRPGAEVDRGSPGGYAPRMTHAIESRRPPTYADIEALAPDLIGEILGGELVVSPRPAGPHAVAASNLGALIGSRFALGLGGPGGWQIIYEPELNLGVDPRFEVVVPDLAGWRLEVMPDRVETAQFHIVPQWVCEVLSPGTRLRDRTLKLGFYARAGVEHLWFVDPLVESLEVYALDGDRWVVVGVWGADDTVSPPPFGALPLPLSWLWGRRPPEPPPA